MIEGNRRVAAVKSILLEHAEAVSQPKVREWLDLSDETYTAQNGEARRAFDELLSPRQFEGEVLPPKLQKANRQVRQLKDIVDKTVPLKMLLDPERPFEEAVRAAEDETVSDETGVLEHSLAQAFQAIKAPSIDAWLNPIAWYVSTHRLSSVPVTVCYQC